MLEKIVLSAGVLMCLLSLARPVRAQDTTMVANVTHVAGANVYLDLGSTQGLATGDTLLVVRNNEVVGRLNVLSVSSKQSVVGFVGQPFSITRAEKLDVRFYGARPGQTPNRAPESEADGPPADPAAQQTRGQPAVQPSGASRSASRKENRVQLQGRVLLNLSIMNSETIPQAEDLDPVKRTFMTPSLNVNATVSNLPTGVRLRLNMRSDYRYNSAISLTRQNIVRAYQLSLERDLPFGAFQLGRFYDRLSAMGGYWDGVSFMYGSRTKGVGASVGFMPDRSNEGFTTQFPRFSGFAQYETGRRAEQPFFRVAAAYHEVQPHTDYLDHQYLGLEQSFTWGRFSLTQQLQLDNDPETKGWVASNFRANTRIKITDWLTLRNRYTIRQPYRMYSTGSPISVRRDQIQTGLNIQVLDARVGLSYTTRYTRETYESRTMTAYATSPPLTRASVSIFGSVNHWEADFGTALYLNGGLSKPVGGTLLRLDYGFYRSTNVQQIDPIDLHRYSFAATVPLGEKMYANLRTSLQQSQYLNSITFNTSLQYRF